MLHFPYVLLRNNPLPGQIGLVFTYKYQKSHFSTPYFGRRNSRSWVCLRVKRHPKLKWVWFKINTSKLPAENCDLLPWWGSHWISRSLETLTSKLKTMTPPINHHLYQKCHLGWLNHLKSPWNQTKNWEPTKRLIFFPCEAAGCAGCVRPAWPARVAAATVEGSMALEDWELWRLGFHYNGNWSFAKSNGFLKQNSKTMHPVVPKKKKLLYTLYVSVGWLKRHSIRKSWDHGCHPIVLQILVQFCQGTKLVYWYLMATHFILMPHEFIFLWALL